MINCIWYNQSKGNWDSGLIGEIFEKNPAHFLEWNLKQNPVIPGSIIIIVGRPEVDPLREYLEKVGYGIVILTSEEDGYFDWKKAIPPKFEIWTQYYTPSTKSEIKERLLLGPPNRIRKYKINKHLPKKYLWSFVGQVQNPFREKCVEVLKTLPDGYLQICSMFGGEGENGMEYQEYLDIMCQSKFVICPAGSMSVDSFRLYEAIECGAIPITDVRAPRDPDGFNYWKEVYFYAYDNLLTVDYWKDLPLLLDSDINSDNNWFKIYKERLQQQLIYAAN